MAASSSSSSFSSSSSLSSSKSSNAGNSYIGSFISLISKYEIRYEGVLYHLSVQDSTIGLKNVRSYGTDGRKKDGPQIPPTDKVYEFILFHGSDIKDLQVKSSPPTQTEESIHNDPAIIQVTQNAGPSFSTPMYWQGYNDTPVSRSHAPQHSIHFQPPSMVSSPSPMQSPGLHDSPIMGLTNASECVTSAPSITSNPVHPNILPSPTPVQYSTSPDMLFPPSEMTSQPPYAAQITANRLAVSSIPLSSQDTSTAEAQSIAIAFSDSMAVHPTKSIPCPAASYVGSISSPLLAQLPSLLSPDQLAQSIPHVHSSTQKVHPDQKDTAVVASLSSTSPPLISTPASQAPLLPLPSSVRQHKFLTTQFTEEFDFEAMNEKFKKDEVWGYLRKGKQRDKTEGAKDNATDQNLGDKEGPGLVSTFDPKPAYKKDEFFDTISCNSITQGRNGQNRFSERMKTDTESFGNFHQRHNVGYGGFGAGSIHNNHGLSNWGQGYGHGGRGCGNMPF